MDRFDTKRDHVRMLMYQQRRVNGLRSRMSDDIAAAIKANAETYKADSFDALQYRLAQQAVDRVLSEYYGQFRGDNRAYLMIAITQSTARCYALAVGRMRRFVRDVLTARGEGQLLAALVERGKVKGER